MTKRNTFESFGQGVLRQKINGDDVFYFKDGCVVSWLSDSGVDKMLLKQVKEYEIDPLDELLTESLDFKAGDKSDIHLECIETVDSNDRLAFSNGLADSLKLESVETKLEQQMIELKSIPQQLMSNKKPPFKRSAVLQILGTLLHLRGSVNLHSDILSPDRFWDQPEMERVYLKVSSLLDVRNRVRIFNLKLDYANELVEVLRRNQAENHSLNLEWAIIVLIAVEVCFATINHFK